MDPAKNFSLNYLRAENHLLMPTRSSILITQQLYDILFQYCITPAKEKQLLEFIHLMETHIKNKDQTPFSIPVEELAGFEEGVEELRLLSWYERPVHVFAMEMDGSELDSDSWEATLEMLATIMICRAGMQKGELYVFPSDISY